MRVLVTGAAGFVGAALCGALVTEGHEVVGFTRDPVRAKKHGRASRYVQGSVGDPRVLAQAARGMDVVFHAAGLPPRPAPNKVLRWLHVAGTENVLNALRHVGVPRLVHLSCADVTLYAGDRMHWDEQRTLPALPVGAHARTKLMAEEIALSASDERLGVTALRPALVWGPGDWSGLAALHAEAKAGGVNLHGAGRNLLATTHIRNLTRAALSALTHDESIGRALYVTDGEFLEAREFFGRLSSALGMPPPRTQGALGQWLARLRGGEAERAVALGRARSALFDLSAATRCLDYEARIDLDAAFAELKDWVASQGGLQAVAQAAPPPPGDGDVAQQVAMAGGE